MTPTGDPQTPPRAPLGPAGAPPPALQVRGLRKRFGSVEALAGVDFEARAGEVHALLGENGAGKSTLMHVVSGLYAADAGEIRLLHRAVRWRSPEDARAAGIAMVHQHFMLVPTLSVAENFALARGLRGWLDRARWCREASELAARHRLEIGDPARLIDDLSVGERQRVEILKALASEAPGEPGSRLPSLLILDEPTAVLTPAEVHALFELLRGLAGRGTAIVIVTHKLAEVMSIADRVTVLRRGRVLGSGEARAYDERALADLMVGDGSRTGFAPAGDAGTPDTRSATDAARAPAASPSPRAAAVLSAAGLSARDAHGALVLDDVSLAVGAGELLVIAGVEGNGQEELVAALAGIARETLRDFCGRVEIGGQPIASAADARAAGLAIVAADRSRDGLVFELAAWENLLLTRDRLAAQSHRGLLRRAAARAQAAALIAEFEVRPAEIERPAGAFSGGNQQRLILARELGRDRLRALVAANPSRGLDLAGTAAVRARLKRAARDGAAVVVLSTDLDEVEELAGRVAVLYRGRLIEPAHQPPSRAQIGRLMAGTSEAA